MRAVFRADASREIGSGHVMRCLTLADALSTIGWDCAFALRSESREVVPALDQSGHELLTLEGGNGDEAAAMSSHWQAGVEWLVVDHYRRDRRFEAACRPWARNIMVLDDLADRPHDCDLLLDQTLGRGAEDYTDLVPSDCRLLLGTRYALLRPEFRAMRQRDTAAAQTRQAPFRLLITLGGTDPENMTEICIDAVQRCGAQMQVDVIAGHGFAALTRLRGRLEGLSGFQLHVAPDNIGALMSAADLAIGAAGTTSWERCCLGLPTVMLVLADNQLENARQLSISGAAAVVEGDGNDMADAIAAVLRDLHGDRDRLHEMSKRAAAICDGQGSLRAKLALLPDQATKDGLGMHLRLAEARDEAILLHWQRQPSIRALARNPAIPTEAEHHIWFAGRMRSENSFITMIEHGRKVAGMLRLDRLHVGDQDEFFEVSIVVDEEHRGAGVGLAALRQIRAWMPTAEFRAETLPNNDPSIALFRTAGYRALKGNLLHSTAA